MTSWKTKMGENFLSKVWIIMILSFACILVSARDHLSLHSEVCLIIAIKVGISYEQ